MPRRSLLAPLAAVLLSAAVACGGSGDAPPVEVVGAPGAPGSGETTPATGAQDATLPTLPPVEERAADLFDDQGCTRTAPDAAACGNTGADIDLEAAGDSADDWRTLAGFVGPYWSEQPVAGVPVVLEQTVMAAAAGPWRARGLVRNEAPGVVDAIEVTAVLVGADGNVLGTVVGRSPVRGVRSGEPVPFELAAGGSGDGVAAEQVAAVQWSAAVVGSGPDEPTPEREVEVSTYWSRDFGGADRVELYLYRDPDDGSRPYLLFGSVLNRGAPAAAPAVVVAWLDGDGRVVAVHEAPVADPHTGQPAAVLAGGGGADFLVVLDDPVEGPAAGPASPMLWGLA